MMHIFTHGAERGVQGQQKGQEKMAKKQMVRDLITYDDDEFRDEQPDVFHEPEDGQENYKTVSRGVADDQDVEMGGVVEKTQEDELAAEVLSRLSISAKSEGAAQAPGRPHKRDGHRLDPN